MALPSYRAFRAFPSLSYSHDEALGEEAPTCSSLADAKGGSIIADTRELPVS